MAVAARRALCVCMFVLLTASLTAAPTGIEAGSGVTPLPMGGSPAVQPNGYGITDEQVVTVNAFEFIPWSSTDEFTADNSAYRWLTSGGPVLAGVRFPSGALATAIEIEGCDTNATSNLLLGLFKTSGIVQLLRSLESSGSGCGVWSAPLPEPVTMSAADSYALQIFQDSAYDGTVKFKAVRVYYILQVSPAPGTATFADVPVGSPLHQYVEALVAAGITAGCGGGDFCPNTPVTRGQMAVFLAKALGLHWAP